GVCCRAIMRRAANTKRRSCHAVEREISRVWPQCDAMLTFCGRWLLFVIARQHGGFQLATRPTRWPGSHELWAAQCSYDEQRAAHVSPPPGRPRYAGSKRPNRELPDVIVYHIM